MLKKIDIIGENYFGKWDKTRIACRGIVKDKDSKNILFSYEMVTDTWIIPGGGLEENETDKNCCIREISEETGVIVESSAYLLEINEYYEDWKFVNRFFLCRPIGKADINLTDNKKRAGMEPRWLPIEDAIDVFSKFDLYVNTDEVRRSMYIREFKALTELLWRV